MTYGILQDSTRTLIEGRAKAENIPMEKLGLEPRFEECVKCNANVNGCDDCEQGYVRPEFLREIAVIYGGMLDETFYLDDLYAVNIADWLAEDCREQAKDDNETWSVVVTIPHPEDSTEVYKVESD